MLILVRAAAGLLLGIAVWSAFAVPYNSLLGWFAERLIRTFERPAVTRLEPRGAELTIDRADFAKSAARPGVTTRVLTANVVLLLALFVANRRAASTENVTRLLIALVALVPVHVLAIVAKVQATYALSLGPWSERHYSAFERNLWGAAAHFYVVIGGFAASFLLWWMLRPGDPQNRPSKRGRNYDRAKRV